MGNFTQFFRAGMHPFGASGSLNQSGFGMHPSVLWQRQPGPVLNSGPWSGVAPSLQGAAAGYTPQAYAAAANKTGLLNPNTPPGG